MPALYSNKVLTQKKKKKKKKKKTDSQIPNVSQGTPHGLKYLLATAGVVCGGMYLVYRGMADRAALADETARARAAITPALQAEEDMCSDDDD
jgi:hypothetical protein